MINIAIKDSCILDDIDIPKKYMNITCKDKQNADKLYELVRESLKKSCLVVGGPLEAEENEFIIEIYPTEHPYFEEDYVVDVKAIIDLGREPTYQEKLKYSKEHFGDD